MAEFDKIAVFVRPLRPIGIIERPNMYITKVRLEETSMILYRNNFNQNAQVNFWDLNYNSFLGLRIGPPEVEIRLSQITIFIAFHFRQHLQLSDCRDFAQHLVPLLPPDVPIINSREPHVWPNPNPRVNGFMPNLFRPIPQQVNGHAQAGNLPEDEDDLPEAEQLENDHPEADQQEFQPFED